MRATARSTLTVRRSGSLRGCAATYAVTSSGVTDSAAGCVIWSLIRAVSNSIRASYFRLPGAVTPRSFASPSVHAPVTSCSNASPFPLQRATASPLIVALKPGAATVAATTPAINHTAPTYPAAQPIVRYPATPAPT